MKKGKMTEEERKVNFQKSIAIGILQGLQVQLGNFNLEMYSNNNGSKGLSDLIEKLTDINNDLIDVLE